LTESLEDKARKAELMECMMGQGINGIFVAAHVQIPYCTLITCEKDKRPYDCGYRGQLIYTSRVNRTGQVENRYECERGKQNGKEKYLET
jgi:hypothetical protein